MSLRENCIYLLQNDTQVKGIDKLNRYGWYGRVSDDKFVTCRTLERSESRNPEPLED